MLQMDQYELIRTAHRVYGKSGRAIARDTGHSRNTIKKALDGELWGYRARQHQPYPVLGPYLHLIDEWLLGDKDHPKKQRHTAHRIYTRLVEEHGFAGSESTVRHYVQQAKRRLGLHGQTAFIPCDPDVGREAEVDWGNATALISGERVQMKFFCMRSKYSGKHFVRCYPCERQQAFFDAHVVGFEFFGGIFPILIYDNLTSAVRKVLQGKDREEQEAFTRFRSYHNFDARFCTPGQGHEKGGVEGLVGYVRRNYFVPIPQAESFPTLNTQVLQQCVRYGSHHLSGRDQSVQELFEQERSHLLALPRVRFTTGRTLTCKVNKYATVLVDRNHYSVPTQYVGLQVQVFLDVDQLRVSYRQQDVAWHTRVYGCNKWQLEPDHYLELLCQRPQAFDSARPMKQWRSQWPVCFERLLERLCERQGRNRGIKEFLSVLLLHREHSREDIKAAVELALEAGVSSSDGVKHVLCHTGPETTIAPLDQWSSFPAPDVSVYTQLHVEPDTGLDIQANSGTGTEPDVDGGVAHGAGGEAR
jgi:transposase